MITKSALPGKENETNSESNTKSFRIQVRGFKNWIFNCQLKINWSWYSVRGRPNTSEALLDVVNKLCTFFKQGILESRTKHKKLLESMFLTVSSSFLFKVCISSTIRRTSDNIACSGIFFKAAFLSWVCRKSTKEKYEHFNPKSLQRTWGPTYYDENG